MTFLSSEIIRQKLRYASANFASLQRERTPIHIKEDRCHENSSLFCANTKMELSNGTFLSAADDKQQNRRYETLISAPTIVLYQSLNHRRLFMRPNYSLFALKSFLPPKRIGGRNPLLLPPPLQQQPFCNVHLPTASLASFVAAFSVAFCLGSDRGTASHWLVAAHSAPLLQRQKTH